MADPRAARDASARQKLGRERVRLEPVVKAGERWLKLTGELAAARELAAGSVALKRLEDGSQEDVPLGEVAAKLEAP